MEHRLPLIQSQDHDFVRKCRKNRHNLLNKYRLFMLLFSFVCLLVSRLSLALKSWQLMFTRRKVEICSMAPWSQLTGRMPRGQRVLRQDWLRERNQVGVQQREVKALCLEDMPSSHSYFWMALKPHPCSGIMQLD